MQRPRQSADDAGVRYGILAVQAAVLESGAGFERGPGEYKRRNIPVDVIVVGLFPWPHMGDYRFDEEFFPDPEAMAKELHDMGIKLMVSVWPQVALRSENFREMAEKGLLVKADKGVQVCMQFVEDSVFFDATNPEARKYVWEKCKKNYYDKGCGSVLAGGSRAGVRRI